MSILRMPDILAHGRWRSGDELDAIARGWLAVVRDTLDDSGRPVAVALPTTPEGVALLVGLSALPSPVIILPPDVRAWRTEPAIPRDTQLVLLPTLTHLAPDAQKLDLIPVVLPEASTRGAAAPPIDPFSGAGIVLLTSGSSGWPKPVFYPMAAELAMVRNRNRSMGLGPGAGIVIEGSPAYAQGLNHLVAAILLGGPLALLDPRDHRLALSTLADPAFQYWRASRHLVGALTSCVLTGPAIVPPFCVVSVPISEELFDAFLERFGIPLRQAYSSTETGTVTLDDSPADRVQRETVGCPLQRVEIHVGDHPGQPAAPDEIGRIWVRSPGQMAGYGFPPHVERPGDVDGWWPTQDLGRLRADGYLVLAGRMDDAIRTRENRVVNLTHVAARLRGIAGVADAVVVAIDTPSGRSFGAVVECHEGLTVAQLRSKLADMLPPWSWPRALELVPALPRLPNGKPDRQACARRLTAGGA